MELNEKIEKLLKNIESKYKSEICVNLYTDDDKVYTFIDIKLVSDSQLSRGFVTIHINSNEYSSILDYKDSVDGLTESTEMKNNLYKSINAITDYLESSIHCYHI